MKITFGFSKIDCHMDFCVIWTRGEDSRSIGVRFAMLKQIKPTQGFTSQVQ